MFWGKTLTDHQRNKQINHWQEKRKFIWAVLIKQNKIVTKYIKDIVGLRLIYWNHYNGRGFIFYTCSGRYVIDCIAKSTNSVEMYCKHELSTQNAFV